MPVSQQTSAAVRLAVGPDTVEDVPARMREHGGRATPARRLLLLEALVSNSGHRSADELRAEVQAHAPDVQMLPWKQEAVAKVPDVNRRLMVFLLYFQRKCTNSRPKFLESFSTRW